LPGGGCKLLEIPREVKPDVIPTYQVHSDSSYSSNDDNTLDQQYNKLCELSLKIINKNKFLKIKKEFLENEVYELKEKAKRLEKSKNIDTRDLAKHVKLKTSV
jgi:hypothetical protein